MFAYKRAHACSILQMLSCAFAPPPLPHPLTHVPSIYITLCTCLPAPQYLSVCPTLHQCSSIAVMQLSWWRGPCAPPHSWGDPRTVRPTPLCVPTVCVVCVCVCVCACTHMYLCTRTHTYTHTHLHMHIVCVIV